MPAPILRDEKYTQLIDYINHMKLQTMGDPIYLQGVTYIDGVE
jgi:hypothetical protein